MHVRPGEPCVSNHTERAILRQHLATSCLCPENLSEAESKSNKLIFFLTEGISRQSSIQAEEWSSLVALTQIYSTKEQKM